ncbi:hypothetical protein H8E77_00225 [bacterium]|nr:hypothetical protein [bacterium]
MQKNSVKKKDQVVLKEQVVPNGRKPENMVISNEKDDLIPRLGGFVAVI